MDFLYNVLWTIVVNVLGLFVGLAGGLLDFAVNNFVIGFGEQYTQNGIGFAVDATWVVIRDFVNMTFIFGLVYIGMRMILSSDSSNTRRWLVNLIIAALLINFSLFITKFIVDVSNQFATAIATQGFNQKVGGGVDISDALMDKIGAVSVLDSSKRKAIDGDFTPPGFGYIFGTAMVLMIAIFVFAAGAILLIIRFAVLNLFFVFSPLLFLGFILPPLAGKINGYWMQLLKKAFFAPIYLLFIYISFSILDGMRKSNAIQNVDLGNSLTPGDGVVDTAFPFFILSAILLIASLVISQKLGAEGASGAVSMGKSLSKKFQRGTTGFVKRNTLGYGAQGLGAIAKGTEKRYQRLDARVQRMNPVARKLIRGGVAVGTLGLMTEKNVSSALTKAQNLNVAGSESYKQMKERTQKVSNRQNETTAIMNREKEYKALTATIDDTATSAEDLEKAFGDLGSLIRKMSVEEKDELGVKKLSSARVAMNLSDKDIEGLEKTGNYSYQEIQDLKKARGDAFETVATSGEGLRAEEARLADPTEAVEFDKKQRQALMNRKVDEVGNMPVKVFTNSAMAMHLTPQGLEQRMKNGGVSNDDIEKIKKNIQDEITTQVGLGNADAVRRQKMWEQWTNRSTYGAMMGLNFTAPNTPLSQRPITQTNQPPISPSVSPIITPGAPGWNAANQNLPPRPGPQP